MKIFLVLLITMMSQITFAEWTDATPSSETLPPIELKGTYQIPTENASEEQNALFPIENYKIIQNKGKTAVIEIEIPNDLVAGQKIPVQLQLELVNGQEKILTGDNTSAYCIGAWKQLKCDVQFPMNQITAVEHNKYLTQKYGQTEKAIIIQKLALKFGNEAIGKFWTTEK